MKITVITLFPKMVQTFFEESIVKRAIDKKLVEIEVVNLRDFALDSYGTVDDRPYGAGAGMVIRVEPVTKALDTVKKNGTNSRVILTSAKGTQFIQNKARELSRYDHVIILAGHYEEFDERVRDFIDEEISLGDFVMTGGEITAAAIVDSVVRLIPGVLKKDDATLEESFFTVSIDELIDAVGDDTLHKMKAQGIVSLTLLEYPHYTRPELFLDKRVPEVLLSGDPKKIRMWRLKEAYLITQKKRPDLLLKLGV